MKKDKSFKSLNAQSPSHCLAFRQQVKFGCISNSMGNKQDKRKLLTEIHTHVCLQTHFEVPMAR